MKQTLRQLDVLKERKGRRLNGAPCIRVSTGEQKKQQTAQIQHQKIIQFGKEQDINLLDPYIDEGYSGELSERPDLHRLLDDIEEKEIDLVILTEPDRLAREFGVQKFIQRQIEEKGALLWFLSAPPAETEDQQVGIDILGLLAGWERGKIKQRTMDGKTKKAKDGYIVGGKAPYGYLYLPRTRERRGYYEINEDEAQWVRKILGWCASEGLSTEAIARRITDQGILTQSGGSVWKKTTIYNMLKNETYAGVAHYNKHQSIPPRNWQTAGRYRRVKNSSRKLRKKDEWIPIPVPAIIDRETWEQAQTQLKRNAKRSPRNTRHPYLLRGKVFCGLCDLPCYASVSRSNLLYQCSNRHRNSPFPKTCSAKSVSAPALEFTVWGALFKALSHPDVLFPQLKELDKAEATTPDYFKQEVKRLNKKLKRLKRAETRAAELYQYDEGMTLREYKDQVQKIRLEKERVKGEKEQLERQVKRRIDWEEAEAHLKFLHAGIIARLHMLSFEEKRKIVELLIDKVIVTGDKVRIDGIIPPISNLSTGSPEDVHIASTSSP